MSNKTVGVIMDHIAGITPAKDSTLAMLLEAQARGHALIHFRAGGPLPVGGRSARPGPAAAGSSDDPESWYELDDSQGSRDWLISM